MEPATGCATAQPCNTDSAPGSRLHKIISLFCKRALLKRLYSAIETCNFKESIQHSHPLTAPPSNAQIIGLFCKRDLLKRLYSAKETYNFKESIEHSHPISAPPSYAHSAPSACSSSWLVSATYYTYTYISPLSQTNHCTTIWHC